MKLKILSLILSALVFTACAHNVKEDFTHTAFIRIISNDVKLAGSAIVLNSKDKTVAQIYSGASVVAVLKASLNKVCINKRCFSNQSFNEKFLGLDSSEDIMLKMLNLKRLDSLSKKDLKDTKRYFNKQASIVILNKRLSFKSKLALFDIQYMN